MDILSIREKQKPLRRYQRSRVLFYAMQQKSPRIFGGFILWMHLSILEINTYYASFFLHGQGFVLFFMHIADNSPAPFFANSLNCSSV